MMSASFSSSSQPRVAVIGAGWAGLSCAEALSQTRASPISVTVFEQAPVLGGRARGLIWEASDGQTHAIDNGQHLAIGAYTQTFALLKKMGALAWSREPLSWCGVTNADSPLRSWLISSKGWPWRMTRSAFGPYAPKHWPLTWRFALAKAAYELTKNNWTTCGTVSQWLEKMSMPKGLIDHFWQPLAEGALNTELHCADAAVFLRVLRDSLGGPRGATDVLTPAVNLSHDGVDAIAAGLSTRGVDIRTASRIQAIDPSCELTVRKGSELIKQSFDAVVLALPAAQSAAVWDASGLMPELAASRRWRDIQYRGITTAWISLDETSNQKLSRLPSWFILDSVPRIGRIAQVCVRRKNILACVMSAQKDPGNLDRDWLRTELTVQLSAQLGIQIGNLAQKWITEKKATWACTPDHAKPYQTEILGLTGADGFFRAADDLEPGYPATIESAVRSGQRTAQAVIAHVRALKPQTAS